MKSKQFWLSMLDWSSKMWVLYASRRVINQSPDGYKWARTLFYQSIEGLGGETWLLKQSVPSQSIGQQKQGDRL